VGPGAGTVKSLEKPNAPAWAVNQLYWTRRKTFDRLMDAAGKLRATHSQLLSGKRADVAAAEAAHRDALKTAVAEVREILSQAGDPATTATMTAVTDTLQALPGPERPGRLARPLKPRGFEALAGLVPGAAAASKRLAEIVPIDRGRPAPKDAGARTTGGDSKAAEATARRAQAEAKRQAEIRKQHLARLDAEIRAARTAERQAESALEKTRDALGRVEKDTERVKKELDALADKAHELAEQIRRQESAARQASSERMRLEERRDPAR
jgi:DNA repair exonuclease SbcCD ATPase subunit